nr:formin-like protein 5 [Lolium perenne]
MVVNRSFATAVRLPSLKPLSVLTPFLIKPHIFSNTKLEMNGSYFMVPVPFCPDFKALSASMRFLFFFVVANLAATSRYLSHQDKGCLTVITGGEDALHKEVDEATQMYSPPPLPPLQPLPIGDACASYLLADGRRNLKFGGRVEEGVEIDHGARWEIPDLLASWPRNSPASSVPPVLRRRAPATSSAASWQARPAARFAPPVARAAGSARVRARPRPCPTRPAPAPSVRPPPCSVADSAVAAPPCSVADAAAGAPAHPARARRARCGPPAPVAVGASAAPSPALLRRRSGRRRPCPPPPVSVLVASAPASTASFGPTRPAPSRARARPHPPRASPVPARPRPCPPVERFLCSLSASSAAAAWSGSSRHGRCEA